MSENDKIKSILEKYKAYIDNSNWDICHSVKDVWFFYGYDSKNNIYECFYKFSTAEELEKIIIGELINNMNIAIECTAEEIVFENNRDLKSMELDIVHTEYDFTSRINKFIATIKAINRTKYLVDEAYQAINDLVL